MRDNRNKYRIPPARTEWWDYGWNGSYFVTICTRARQHFFGEVIDGKMELSVLGRIADERWRDLVNHATDLELGPHVVMPNHIHGILNLHTDATLFKCVPSERGHEGLANSQEEIPKTIGKMRFRNPGKNTISTIVGGYKSAVSKEAVKQRCHFGWQSRFHDHIIRDAEEYQRIEDYILNNPARWKGDKFYSE